MRSMSSSVSCVSSSTPPPCPVGRHRHGRPREPQDRAQTNPRAHGNNDGPTTQLPASDYTPGSPRPSDNDVSGRPAPIFTQDGPSNTAKTRDYTQHRGVPSSPAFTAPVSVPGSGVEAR